MKILITGTSRGIGKAIAKKFLQEGHEVYGMDLLPSSIEHPNYTHFIHDVREADYPEIMGLEAVINNAGVSNEGESDIETNALGTIRLSEHYLKANSPKVFLNIASASARNGSEFPYYVASKAAVVAYTKNLASRIASYGGIANTISPGGVLTESNNRVLLDEKKKEEAIGESLLGKWAKVEEIAEWAYFLVTKNKSMTGEDILIDNGEILKSNFVW